jgi:hypothetical protein
MATIEECTINSLVTVIVDGQIREGKIIGRRYNVTGN